MNSTKSVMLKLRERLASEPAMEEARFEARNADTPAQVSDRKSVV